MTYERLQIKPEAIINSRKELDTVSILLTRIVDFIILLSKIAAQQILYLLNVIVK